MSPKDFAELLVERGFSVYIGSGIVCRWFPDWNLLVKRLCKATRLRFPLGEVSSDRLMHLADDAYQKDEAAFRRLLFREFGPQYDHAAPNAYRWIVDMPFRSILTTNFDHVLADVSRTARRSRRLFVYPDLNPTEISAGGVFYIHGKVNNAGFNYDNIVLGTRAFQKAYEGHAPVTRFLECVLSCENVVFLGCRLSERPVRALLRTIKAQSDRSLREFGILPGEKIMITHESEHATSNSLVAELPSLGIRIMTYPNLSGPRGERSHNALYQFLYELSLLEYPEIRTQPIRRSANEIY